MYFLKNHGEKIAFVDNDNNVSYNELLQHIEVYSSLFDSEKCNKVAIFSENRIEWPMAFYAAWRNKATNVTIDFMSTAEEVSYILNDSRPEIIFYSESNKETFFKAQELLDYKINAICIDEVELPAKMPSAPKEIFIDDLEETAVIIYTSGTTGSPKGVMLSYKNIYVNLSTSSLQELFKENERVFAILPFHHIFALGGCIIRPLQIGATTVLCRSFAPTDITKTMNDNQVTLIVGVPRFYSLIRKGIMDKINSNFITKFLFFIASLINSITVSKIIFKALHNKMGGKIRYLACAGASIDYNILRDLTTLGFEVIQGYGMTETSPIITISHPKDNKIGATGKALECAEVRIKNGEVIVRGDNVMKGYYNRPEETAETIKDGWLYTGDLGEFDKDGFLFITGRKKEILVLPNGKNVPPEEAEFKLQELSPLIAEIGVFNTESILHAIIFPNFAEVTKKGIVNLKETLLHDAIDKYNRTVSPYKRISKVTIVKTELPKTRLGKLRRFMLKSLTEEVMTTENKVKDPKTKEYTLIKGFLSDISDSIIFPNNHFEIDLGLDSLDKVTLQEFVLSTFGISLTDSQILENPTPQKLAEFIAKNKSKMTLETIDWSSILKSKMDIKIPKASFTYPTIRNITKAFLKTYFRLKGEGIENIPNTPCIMVPNHQSFLDGFLVISYLKNIFLKNTYFYAKEKHMNGAIKKFLARKNNIITLNINSNLKESIQRIAAVIAEGKNIVIFPEGTRTNDGELGKFKKMFAILSKELNVPVIPVSINGAYEAFPKGSFFPRPFKKITIKFLPPVCPNMHSYDSIIEKVRGIIKKDLKKTKNKY